MIARIFSTLVPLALLMLAPSPARAAWHEASSDHFVIYADDDEQEIRRYAENLERYHSAMEHFTGRTVEKPSPSNRVTVYAIGSADQVRRLAGSSGVAGFYIPRAEGSVAFVQDIRNKDGYPDLSTVVLLHEYAHHFLSSTDRFAMPLWMNEGAAEFFSAAYFREDGSVFLGMPSSQRSFTIFWKEEEMTPVREVLDLDWSRLNGRVGKSKDSFYGRSWLLYHYLSMSEERTGQLREYWLEVLRGTPSLDAAQLVFGDLGVLERQLNRHIRDRDRKSYHVGPDEITVSPITLRRLDEGEAAIMDIRIRADRGVAPEEAQSLAAEARALEGRFPDNANVLTVLAETEYGAGNDRAASEAADRALALDAQLVDAYLYKGLAGFRLARGMSDLVQRDAAYGRAIEPLRALAAIEPDHTVPLVYAYRYHAERGAVPPSDAKEAFARAARLAPFDQELWLLTGMMHMNDGRIADARAALQPLASNPHGGDKAEQVRGLLAFLADKPEGRPIPVQDAISAYFIEE
ncbi:hypothetical protein [Erythrobacter sp. JK5]|uniref:hypothetical protein n=1 Tax=Erythrobacter sp. JK5 TaxID=2829500 RepID=UPI001BAA2D91|nr:hypothetical protein [Erythrobacter sp. JK5]QUL36478.1 hypothetical protein KDC96_08440 [Erythrobacter sp. JK5]